MIKAYFYCTKCNQCSGFKVSGHANSAKLGEFDLVCCAVSVAVRMCCNGITEVAKCAANICSNGDAVELKINNSCENVQFLLKTLKFELKLIEKEYSKFLKVIEQIV